MHIRALFLTTCLALNPVDRHYYGTINKGKTWADNENVLYTDLNDNFDDIYNEFNGNIENANVKAGAAIDVAKISGTAVNLSSTQTITGVKTFDAAQTFKEVSTPSNPSSGYRKLYPKSDGFLYLLDSSGNEVPIAGTDGWTKETNTLTYASSTTFTIAGVDLTTRYSPGTRIKFTQTSAKYFVVVSSSFSTNTTVTVTGGDDYSVANAAITSPYYSYDANPEGYPGRFAYTPSYTGFSANPTVDASFSVIGRTVFYYIGESANGTSNSTSKSISLPITSSSAMTTTLCFASVIDNGTQQIGKHAIGPSASVTASYPAVNVANWTNSGNCRLFEGGGILIYEI